MSGMGTVPDIIMGKKPGEALKDNLMMAALAGTGMAVAPALAGGSAAADAIGGGMASMAEQHAIQQAMASQGGGLLGGLKTTAGYVKPAGEALGAANAAKGLLSSDPMQPAPLQQPNPMGMQGLLQIAQQGQQAIGAQGEADMARRQRRGQLVGGLF